MKTFSEYINQINEELTPELAELKRRKQNVYMNIRYAKKKGKDTSKLEKEYAEICAQIELIKNGGNIPPTTAPIDTSGISAKFGTIVDMMASQVQGIVLKLGSNEIISRSIVSDIKSIADKIIAINPQKFSKLLDKHNISDYDKLTEFAEACVEIDKKLAEDLVTAVYELTNIIIRAQAIIHKHQQTQSQQSKTIDPNSDDYKAGYEAAMKAIEEQMKKNKQSGQGGAGNMKSSQSDSGLKGIPQNPEDGEGDSSGSAGQQGTGSGQSRDDSTGDGSQGVVRPEDCVDPSRSLQDCPDNAGGIISKSNGDKIAAAEGYDKSGGNDDSIGKEWGERAQQAASKMAGKGAGYGEFIKKVNNLYKVSKDWKKELKNIVGHSINTDDKRSAFANKNVLISQNRLARTDKDKYDCSDYMIAAIDTSGSMSQEFLEACLREVYQVALAKKPLKLIVCQFDTRITDIQTYTSIPELMKDLKKFKIRGGGGTDVKPVFDLLKTDRQFKGRRADLVLIFTDGFLDQYKRDSRTMQNLCWVIVDNPSFSLIHRDAQTKCVRINMSDIK